MKKPPHPGRSDKDACLGPLALTVTQGAPILGVARHTLSRVINGQAGISPDMGIRNLSTTLRHSPFEFSVQYPVLLDAVERSTRRRTGRPV